MGKKTRAYIEFIAINKIAGPIRSMGRGVSNFLRNATRDAKSLARSMRVVNNQFNRMTAGMRRFMPAMGLLSAGGILMGGRSAVQTAAELEALATSIEFASGSAESGAKNMAFLRKVSKDLKIDFMSASEGFNLFAANASAAKIPMEQIRKTFLGVSKMIRVQGRSAQSTISIYRALAEMYSKTTIQAQEMNLQLAPALPGSQAWMAQAAGFTGKDKVKFFKEKMGKGTLRAEDILPKFGDIVGALADPGVAKAIKNATSEITDLNNQWMFLNQTIGNMLIETGVIQHISAIVAGMHDWVKLNRSIIGQKLNAVVEKTVEFGTFVMDNWTEIRNGIKAIVLTLLVFKGVLVTMQLFAIFTNPVSLAAVAVLGLGAALIYAIDWSKQFREENRKGAESLTLLENAALSVDNIFSGVGKFLDDDLWAGIKQVFWGILQIATTLVQTVVDLLDELFNLGEFGNLFGNFFSEGSKELDETLRMLDALAQGKDPTNYDIDKWTASPAVAPINPFNANTDGSPNSAAMRLTDDVMVNKINKLLADRLNINITNATDSVVSVDKTQAAGFTFTGD